VVAPRNPIETRLTEIWGNVLGITPISVTDNFFDLGATSITAARVFARIERELGAALPMSPLFQAPTIERLAALIGQGKGEHRYLSLVPVQPNGDKIPIFCVHGGAGTILHFQPLSKHLGESQPFYGLQMQGLYGDAPPHLHVEAMATHYLSEIRSVQPRGPYIIAGYCFGAIVAFEIAQQLDRGGERVALLVSINGPSPAYIKTSRGRNRQAAVVEQTLRRQSGARRSGRSRVHSELRNARCEANRRRRRLVAQYAAPARGSVRHERYEGGAQRLGPRADCSAGAGGHHGDDDRPVEDDDAEMEPVPDDPEVPEADAIEQAMPAPVEDEDR